MQYIESGNHSESAISNETPDFCEYKSANEINGNNPVEDDILPPDDTEGNTIDIAALLEKHGIKPLGKRIVIVQNVKVNQK